MDFFGIGPLEILLIFVLAIILLGPGKITEVARTLGKVVRTIKKAGSDITLAVSNEVQSDQNKASPANTGKPKTGEKPSTDIKTTISGRDDNPAKPGETSNKI
jgi:Sec-independent protein translocase protein TatA